MSMQATTGPASQDMYADSGSSWLETNPDVQQQQQQLAPDTWVRPLQGTQQQPLRDREQRTDDGGGRSGLSLGDPLAAATLLIRPGGGRPSTVLAAQGQLAGAAPADAAAMLQAQRRALLQLKQQLAAAAAQQQLLLRARQLPRGGRDEVEQAAQQQHQQQGERFAQQQQQQQQYAQQGESFYQQQQQQQGESFHQQQQQQQQYGQQGESSHQQQQGERFAQQQQQQYGQQAERVVRQQQGRQGDRFAQQQQQQRQQEGLMGPVIEVVSDLLEKEGKRVLSALSGGRVERAWALNALCLLSHQQELRLSATPGLLSAILPVIQEGLAAAVGLSTEDGRGKGLGVADMDALRQQQGLPPLPGWQLRQAERTSQGLFPDHERLEERLQEAAAAAVVLRNVAEVQQNAAMLLDPPVMRCWTWALDAARELVQQQVGTAGSSGGAGGGDDGNGTLIVASGGTAADICTTLLQMATVLSTRMLLPAFFECGMLLLRSLLILLRPSWQYSAAAAGGAILPPPLVALATQAVSAVATAYQPNTDILLSMTGAPGGGQPGLTLMQVIADLLVCPFEVFRQHSQQEVDEESPGWRLLLPTDAELLTDGKRSSRAGSRSGGSLNAASTSAVAQDRSTAELCILDMMAVLSQLRYLSSLLHLLWRLLTSAGPAGSHARSAVAGCPRLLSTLCEIAVHRWPQHPVRWHADGHTLRHPEAYPAYLRFLSHDMMPAMRERQELLQPLRADAAALMALMAADPATRKSVAWCEGQLVTAVMLGVVPPTEPGISALLARFAAQGGSDDSGRQGSSAAASGAADGMQGSGAGLPPAFLPQT